MLDKDAKEVWCQALESGEFKQCKGTLKKRFKKDTYFCCLGVAREIFPNIFGTSAGTSLNTKSLHLLGLAEADQYKLIVLNDNKEYSFKAIAKFIRKYL